MRNALVCWMMVALCGWTMPLQAQRATGTAIAAPQVGVRQDAAPAVPTTATAVAARPPATEPGAAPPASSFWAAAWAWSAAGVASFWTQLIAALLAFVALGGGVWWWMRRAPRGGGQWQGAARARPLEAVEPSGYEAATLSPESTVHYDEPIDEVASRTGGRAWHVPEEFDSISFLQSAKRNFVLLQEAWDRADVPLLASLMTDDMLARIRHQLAERGDQPNRTDVVTLEAQLIGVEDLGAAWLASVEFSGMIREEISAGAAPFREVWSLTKPRDGSCGWLLAGVQALQ
ncbi:MAG TPA: TIM44-like domain-containing protein [Burkholderiaceae bacterium]|nr:TIM44-like domain-containing protein [Burkholderiaceae bacterium]